MLEFAISKSEDDPKKNIHATSLTNESKQFMRKSGAILYPNPSKLPMIVKDYKLIDGEITLGSLTNDVLVDLSLIIIKIGYGEPTTLNPNNAILKMINGLSSRTL